MDPVNVPAKFEVRSFTRFWDNRENSKNVGSPWIRTRSIFSQILMVRMDPVNIPAKFEVRSFTLS